MSPRFSATNCARMYELALSQDGYQQIDQGPWRFTARLATEHVWDAFVILSLLKDHERQGTILDVPHIGLQKDRFSGAMEARNERIICYGQPEVSHYCDKCMRTFAHDDNTMCAYTYMSHAHLDCKTSCSQMPSCRDRWPYNRTPLLWCFPLHPALAKQPGSFLHGA
jgi:hypothetical protein